MSTASSAHGAALDDPVYRLEIIYGDGSRRFKAYDTLAGLKTGIASIRRDMTRPWRSPYTAAGFKVHKGVATWTELDPNNL